MKINSNSVRTLALALLVSVAAPVAATSAPVTEVGAGGTTVDRLERMLQARNQMQLDMQRQLDQMAQELSTLRGNVERNSYEIKQVLNANGIFTVKSTRSEPPSKRLLRRKTQRKTPHQSALPMIKAKMRLTSQRLISF